MTDKLMTCESVDGVLLDLLEGDLSAEMSAAVNAHVVKCARCTALLRDIGNIRESAAALPDLAPSGNLWKGIAARIETPVVALTERKVRRIASPVWLAAAASLLVIASSGITYWAASRSAAPERTVIAVASTASQTETPKVDEPAVTVENATHSVASAQKTVAQPRVGGGVRLVSTGRGTAFGPDTIFASEISRLQRVINEKRNYLDPQTVRVVERNLQLIDAAIQSSRSALAQDPASGFLNQQLSRALDKKVELLRTVALLPST